MTEERSCETEERTCSACGRSFRFKPAFYDARGMRPPRRCSACRDERNRSRIRGRVRRVGPLYAFITGDDGNEYFLLRLKLPSAFPLARGDRIEFYPARPDGPGLPKACAPRIVR